MSTARSKPPPAGRRAWGVPALLLLALAVWIAAGVRRIDPAARLAVVEWPGGPRRIAGSWLVAPPGLVRLALYPLGERERPLPGAERARLVAADGSRFGLRGSARLAVIPEAWRALHAAAGGGGLDGVLLDALRAATPEVASARSTWTATRERSLRQRLGEALGARGVELLGLRVDAVDSLAGGAAAAGAAPDTRLLVVGLDGADWRILDDLLAAGRLPHLAGLIARGTRAKLLSISPLISPVVWTTVATGVEPTRHGVLDFLVEGAGQAPQPVTSAQRRVPAVWELLSAAGLEVGVVGWWASWPAEPVRGFLVSDRVAFQLFGFSADPADSRGKTWPPDLYDRVRDLVVRPEDVGWDRVEPYLEGSRRRAEDFDAAETELLDGLRTLLASGETYVRIAERLAADHDPRLELVYLEGTDTVGHLFMPYRPPQPPGLAAGRAASFAGVVDRYYETADAQLGRLLAGRDPQEWNVLVLSDHGFATDATRPRTTDSRIGHGAAADWHRRFGVLVLAGPQFRGPQQIEEATVYDIAPTILALFGQAIPRSWPGRVLGEAFEPDFFDARPVRFREQDPERAPLSAGAAGDDPAAHDLLRKLRSLGYVSGPGEAGEAATARNNAGVSLLAQGRPAEAEREFREALAGAGEGFPVLTLNLAVALRLQGRTEEALPLLERARRARATRRTASNELARIRLEAEDLDGAERLVREVLAEEPDAADARDTLGQILERRGDPSGAERSFRRAAELDPDAAAPRNHLGNLLRGRGEPERAEGWYLRAIEADPHFLGAYNNLALILQERGQPERAIDLYGRALAKEPDNAVVLNNLGSLHWARGDTDEAERLWERARRSDPDYPSPLNNLAGLAIGRRRLDEAWQLLERAVALDPGYGDARMNRALVLEARGEIDAARAELVRAAADPQAARRARVALGRLELAAGRPEAAAAALGEALGLGGPDADLLNLAALAHEAAGRPDEARRLWRRSLELRPDQPAVRRRIEGTGGTGREADPGGLRSG